MAIVNIPDKNLTLRGTTEITDYLSKIGIDYERWQATRAVSSDASETEILAAYAVEIERLKARGGYSAADVVSLIPTTPNLEIILDKFNCEHWHDEDEVRFIVDGHGLFHIAPNNADVVSIEMEAGDLIRVPRGTLHWFNLCGDKTVRAIRLFEDVSGWTPHYTESKINAKYEPLCFSEMILS